MRSTRSTAKARRASFGGCNTLTRPAFNALYDAEANIYHPTALLELSGEFVRRPYDK